MKKIIMSMLVALSLLLVTGCQKEMKTIPNTTKAPVTIITDAHESNIYFKSDVFGSGDFETIEDLKLTKVENALYQYEITVTLPKKGQFRFENADGSYKNTNMEQEHFKINEAGNIEVVHSGRYHFVVNSLTGSIISTLEVKSVDRDDFIKDDLKKGTPIVLTAYIQYFEYDGKTVDIFMQDEDGGYFTYGLTVTEDEYNAFNNHLYKEITILGEKDKVNGFFELSSISEWYFSNPKGDREFRATPYDITSIVTDYDAMSTHQGELITLDCTVELCRDEENNPCAFLYKYNGTGRAGDDLYIHITEKSGIELVVETDVFKDGSELYEYVENNLQVGDKITVVGYLWWYNGPQPHIISLVPQGE